jgi:acyl-CoA thioester hydrolase
MEEYILPVQIRWSDLDPNFHIRHTVYFEWGAMCRMEFLGKSGLTLTKMQELRIGPILFREECIFRKEIRLEDKVTVDFKMTKAKRDFSRFSVQHEIKKEKEILAAMISVDIAWMSGVTRKLAVLPAGFISLLNKFPEAEGFYWVD